MPRLAVHEEIERFFTSLFPVFESGLDCPLYHRIKLEELYILLGWHHRSEEVSSLLHPAFSGHGDFKDFVLLSYREADDVSGFAALAHMGIRSFQRRFKSEFGCSVREWLIARRAEEIFRELRGSERHISDLASDYGFSTASSFSNFCKRHFGLRPSELRRQPRSPSSYDMQSPFSDFPGGGEIPRTFPPEKNTLRRKGPMRLPYVVLTGSLLPGNPPGSGSDEK